MSVGQPQHEVRRFGHSSKFCAKSRPGDSDQPIPVVAEADRITVLPGGGMAGAFISLINTWASSRSVTRQVAVPNG